MRRSTLLIVLISCLASGCNGSTDGATTSSSALPAPPDMSSPASTGDGASDTSHAPPTSSSLPTPPTASLLAATELTGQVLVANTGGIFTVGTDGAPRQVVVGNVALAVDDTDGGVMYQTDVGRRRIDEHEERSTVVWWLPRHGSRARDLLVPSSGHELTLHDVWARDGQVTVLYSRSEGVTPDDMVDRLRIFDVASGTSNEVWSQSAWEQGFGPVSVGGATLAFTRFGQVSSWLTFVDLEGELANGVVPPDDETDCEATCPRGVQLSPDGSRYAYFEAVQRASDSATDVVVRESSSGGELARITLDDSTWSVASLDLTADAVLINRVRLANDGSREPLPAWVVGYDSQGPSSPLELQVAGAARFVREPVDISDPLLLGPATEAGHPIGSYDLAGRDPGLFPDSPFAIAFLGFDDPVSELIEEFGPPSNGSDLDDGVWELVGGAWMARNRVEGASISAYVPSGSEVRLALYGGVVLGRSTVGDLIGAWGEPLHATDLGSCPGHDPMVPCTSLVYTSSGTEIRFFWPGTGPTSSDRVLEGIWIADVNWPMFFLDNGAVTLGIISEQCSERGCRIHSQGGVFDGETPFYSWGADCLDPSCEYAAVFVGTAPPEDVPIASRWHVQSSHAVGGLLLVSTLDGSVQVVGSALASQSSLKPLAGPVGDPDRGWVFHYTEADTQDRYEAWEIDLERVTITRLACEGVLPTDCRSVFTP